MKTFIREPFSHFCTLWWDISRGNKIVDFERITHDAWSGVKSEMLRKGYGCVFLFEEGKKNVGVSYRVVKFFLKMS